MREKERRDGQAIKQISDTLFLMFDSEEEAQKYFDGEALAVGICQNDNGEWGYWDYDIRKDKKTWVIVEIPEDVEDFRETYPVELSTEKSYYDAYMEFGEEAIAKGFEPGTNEFNIYVSEKLNNRFIEGKFLD